MTTLSTIMAFGLPVLCLAVSIFVCVRTMKKSRNFRKAIARHLVTLVVALAVCSVLTVLAANGDTDTAAQALQATAGTDSGAGLATSLGFIGAALSVGLAAIGAGIALSGGAPAAIGAISEDPQAFGKAMIFVVLGEAVAIYGFIIAFMILMKIPNLPQL